MRFHDKPFGPSRLFSSFLKFLERIKAESSLPKRIQMFGIKKTIHKAYKEAGKYGPVRGEKYIDSN